MTTCIDCKRVLKLKVCHSAAGYYIGYCCDTCGPWSRVSGYMTKEGAEKVLPTYTKEEPIVEEVN